MDSGELLQDTDQHLATGVAGFTFDGGFVGNAFVDQTFLGEELGAAVVGVDLVRVVVDQSGSAGVGGACGGSAIQTSRGMDTAVALPPPAGMWISIMVSVLVPPSVSSVETSCSASASNGLPSASTLASEPTNRMVWPGQVAGSVQAVVRSATCCPAELAATPIPEKTRTAMDNRATKTRPIRPGRAGSVCGPDPPGRRGSGDCGRRNGVEWSAGWRSGGAGAGCFPCGGAWNTRVCG